MPESKIGIQLLIGQNEEPFLQAALESVSWVDYVTCVNTAPDSYWGKINQQAVINVCTELDIELRTAIFDPEEDGTFSFADARNACLEQIEKDDYVFILDADDVHYPQWEQLVRHYMTLGYDSITAYYFHLMVYKDVYQAVYPREIVYKNYEGTTWVAGVHEQLLHEAKWPVVDSYHYMHYGYIKPQSQIFDRWKFYSDIVGDFEHYKGQDPNNIVTDRLSVSKPLMISHPGPVQGVLEYYPSCPDGALKENWEMMPSEKVGLVLLTYNDGENLSKCLDTLALSRGSYGSFSILVIDMGSTDNSVELLDKYSKTLNIEVYETGELLPLSQTLNFGFSHFRQRHDIQYIGWIHPDMIFDHQDWLAQLVSDLHSHPKIGKICAANTRDNVPETYIEGHEQCYIIRKEILNTIGLFDEGYVGIGGYEDWDMNRRIMNHDDYKVMISPKAKVFHIGMGTRSKRDTTFDQVYNARYYQNKWGSSEPPC